MPVAVPLSAASALSDRHPRCLPATKSDSTRVTSNSRLNAMSYVDLRKYSTWLLGGVGLALPAAQGAQTARGTAEPHDTILPVHVDPLRNSLTPSLGHGTCAFHGGTAVDRLLLHAPTSRWPPCRTLQSVTAPVMPGGKLTGRRKAKYTGCHGRGGGAGRVGRRPDGAGDRASTSPH